jgi:hypothetical protein
VYYKIRFLLLACVSTASLSACHEGKAEQKEPVMKVYSSPNAVFDAYRQAYRSGDLRTLYFLFTTDAQRDLVFEANFACEDAGGAKFESLKKVRQEFGASEADLGRRYLEGYKRKHGHGEEIDKYLAKAVPYWESKKKAARGTKTRESDAVPAPDGAAVATLPNDEELVREALFGATKDKVGFFTAVQKVLEEGRTPNIIGDLEQVAIEGDKATGRAKITIVPPPGESPRVRNSTVRFYRRI